MLFVSVLVYSRLFVYSYPVYRIVHLLYVTCFMYFLPHRSSFIFYLLYLLFTRGPTLRNLLKGNFKGYCKTPTVKQQRQAQTANLQSSTANHQPQTEKRKPPNANRQTQTAKHKPPTTKRKPRKPPIA